MNNKGFTLVELLAVIVILAVLALIATPVVLSIIDDTKESAMLRSAEMYLSGVENAVMRENMNSGGNFRPNDCTISNGTLSCNGTTVEVEVNGEVPTEGTIVFENGKIKEVELIYESGTIIKDDSGILTMAVQFCTLINDFDSNESVTYGDKLNCKVNETENYNFFVLSINDDGTINLILERNIYYDETNDTTTVADETNKGTVYWISENDYVKAGGSKWSENVDRNMYGPITVMNYLYMATKKWTNVPNIIMNYTDEGNNDDYGYGTIVTIAGITKITKKDKTPIIVLNDKEGYQNLKARLPYNKELPMASQVNIETVKFLFDYLSDSGKDYQTNILSGIYGYLGLSSSGSMMGQGDSMTFFEYRYGRQGYYSGGKSGVRPVITISNYNITSY